MNLTYLGLRESPHPFRALNFYNSYTITITLLFFLHLIFITGLSVQIYYPMVVGVVETVAKLHHPTPPEAHGSNIVVII